MPLEDGFSIQSTNEKITVVPINVTAGIFTVNGTEINVHDVSSARELFERLRPILGESKHASPTWNFDPIPSAHAIGVGEAIMCYMFCMIGIVAVAGIITGAYLAAERGYSNVRNSIYRARAERVEGERLCVSVLEHVSKQAALVNQGDCRELEKSNSYLLQTTEPPRSGSCEEVITNSYSSACSSKMKREFRSQAKMLCTLAASIEQKCPGLVTKVKQQREQRRSEEGEDSSGAQPGY